MSQCRRKLNRQSFDWLFLVLISVAWPNGAVADSAPAIDYGQQIQPILADSCLSCHGIDEADRQAGLRLDSRDAALQKLESGAIAIVPGLPEESEVIRRIESTDADLRMPPADAHPPLSEEQIALFRQWIREGAPYSAHWAFTAPVRPKVPATKDQRWPRNDLDRFILSRLEAEGLGPSPEADRHVLIRRLSLDLRGLPPTPEEVAAFVNDKADDAYERLVDRFLADPAYGERWARVWLDLARYADSKGYGSDPLRLTIWRYRDWVIEAFNRNLPYDQFTIEQLAGDLLPEPTPEQLLATAFHRNTMTNTEGGTDDEEFRVAAVKDRTDTTIQVWMGLTFGCAKCHNHKYDPISQREYYQLYAIFNQTEDSDKPDDAPLMASPTAEMIERNRQLDDEIARLRATLDMPTPELVRAQAEWEEELRQPIGWQVWTPAERRTASGAELALDGNGLIRVTGPAGANDVYTLGGEIENRPITAIKLESVPDPTTPARGDGRAPDGNFVLSRIEAEAIPLPQKEAKVHGRYVRIELPGKERILSLAEVQVFRGRINQARDKQASQSSTDFAGDARRAVDGNSDGHYFNANSTTHTRTESDPWWEVDLGMLTPIDTLTIWNRSDGQVGSRLANFDAVILDAERREVWRRSIASPPNPRLDVDVSRSSTLAIESAHADFEQVGFAIASTLGEGGGTSTGWAVGPAIDQPHVATFLTRQVPTEQSKVRLTVRLEHRFKDPGFSLGQFRVSFTTDERVRLRSKVPARELAILDKPVAERTTDERNSLAAHFRSIHPSMETVRKEIDRLEKSREAAPMVPVLRELPKDQARETYLLVKGSFLTPGEKVEPGVPEVFPKLPTGGPVDRLALARWLVSPENPLTARVAVNRFWGRLFGKGIVESEEDFGTQGDLPTHPELLDWLATEFMKQGWDIKAYLRLLVTSATYRQSSRVRPELLEKDPRNVLYARMSRSRLEAEVVLDQALALAGLLARKQKGPSVFPPQPEGLWRAAFNGSDRTWATSAGEDRYRRALYVFWRRTIPYPSLATFDAPSREICTIRRNQTNTPLQALVTLNDPVYVEAAQGLARRLVREGGSTPADRIRFGLELCLSRPATPGLIAPLARLYELERKRFAKDPEAAKAFATDPLGQLTDEMDPVEMAAWTAIANVLLNLDAVLSRG